MIELTGWHRQMPPGLHAEMNVPQIPTGALIRIMGYVGHLSLLLSPPYLSLACSAPPALPPRPERPNPKKPPEGRVTRRAAPRHKYGLRPRVSRARGAAPTRLGRVGIGIGRVGPPTQAKRKKLLGSTEGSLSRTAAAKVARHLRTDRTAWWGAVRHRLGGKKRTRFERGLYKVRGWRTFLGCGDDVQTKW